MAKYWSEAIAFKPIQLTTVLKNNPKIEVASFNNSLVILAKAPMASIVPPKTIAQQIRKIVHNIPFIPPALNNSFNLILSVTISVSTKMAFTIALKFEDAKPLNI